MEDKISINFYKESKREKEWEKVTESKRERGGGHTNERDTWISCFLHVIQLGLRIEPATHVYAHDQELNQKPVGMQADALTILQHQLGQHIFYLQTIIAQDLII